MLVMVSTSTCNVTVKLLVCSFKTLKKSCYILFLLCVGIHSRSYCGGLMLANSQTPVHPLIHSPLWQDRLKIEVRGLVDWDNDSSIKKAKAARSTKAKNFFLLLPTSQQMSRHPSFLLLALTLVFFLFRAQFGKVALFLFYMHSARGLWVGFIFVVLLGFFLVPVLFQCLLLSKALLYLPATLFKVPHLLKLMFFQHDFKEIVLICNHIMWFTSFKDIWHRLIGFLLWRPLPIQDGAALLPEAVRPRGRACWGKGQRETWRNSQKYRGEDCNK